MGGGELVDLVGNGGLGEVVAVESVAHKGDVEKGGCEDSNLVTGELLAGTVPDHGKNAEEREEEALKRERGVGSNLKVVENLSDPITVPLGRG